MLSKFDQNTKKKKLTFCSVWLGKFAQIVEAIRQCRRVVLGNPGQSLSRHPCTNRNTKWSCFLWLSMFFFFFFFAFLAVWGCCSSRTNPKWPAAAAGGQGIEPRTWSGRLGGRSEGAMGRRARTMRDKFPAGGDAAKEGRRRSLVGRVPKVNRQ